MFRGGIFLTGVFTLFVVAAVTHQRAMAGVLLGTPVLSWVGTRSYGLYLYHWPIYQIIRQEAGKTLSLWQFLLAMLITAGLTEASYRYVEMPIRKGAIGAWAQGGRRRPSHAAAARRRQLTAAGVVAVVLTGWAGVSIAMAPNQCVGVVECANEEGQALIESASSTTRRSWGDAVRRHGRSRDLRPQRHPRTERVDRPQRHARPQRHPRSQRNHGAHRRRRDHRSSGDRAAGDHGAAGAAADVRDR